MTSETCANCGHTWGQHFGQYCVPLRINPNSKKFMPQNHSPQKQEGYADVKAKDKSLLSSSGGKQK